MFYNSKYIAGFSFFYSLITIFIYIWKSSPPHIHFDLLSPLLLVSNLFNAAALAFSLLKSPSFSPPSLLVLVKDEDEEPPSVNPPPVKDLAGVLPALTELLVLPVLLNTVYPPDEEAPPCSGPTGAPKRIGEGEIILVGVVLVVAFIGVRYLLKLQ